MADTTNPAENEKRTVASEQAFLEKLDENHDHKITRTELIPLIIERWQQANGGDGLDKLENQLNGPSQTAWVRKLFGEASALVKSMIENNRQRIDSLKDPEPVVQAAPPANQPMTLDDMVAHAGNLTSEQQAIFRNAVGPVLAQGGSSPLTREAMGKLAEQTAERFERAGAAGQVVAHINMAMDGRGGAVSHANANVANAIQAELKALEQSNRSPEEKAKLRDYYSNLPHDIAATYDAARHDQRANLTPQALQEQVAKQLREVAREVAAEPKAPAPVQAQAAAAPAQTLTPEQTKEIIAMRDAVGQFEYTGDRVGKGEQPEIGLSIAITNAKIARDEVKASGKPVPTR